MNQIRSEAIKELLLEVKRSHYTNPYLVSDAQAMGILMAHYFEWDGGQILKATFEALEDSNFHGENKTIEKLIKKLE